jgi:hypothetical protein
MSVEIVKRGGCVKSGGEGENESERNRDVTLKYD